MMMTAKCISEQLVRKSTVLTTVFFNRSLIPPRINVQSWRGKKANSPDFGSLIQPVPVKSNPDDINIGAELSGNLKKSEVDKILIQFMENSEIQQLASNCGLNDYHIQKKAFLEFRNYCSIAETLPADLHIVLNDIIHGVSNVADIFPYFLRHVKKIFPHIDCLDDLKKISDLRSPVNWYPLARSKPRKIVFHAGPTNSGKTYHALERFLSAKSGVYCGPLKLLVVEVFHKSINRGTPCDLVTGEERRFAHNPDQPANHTSCSVEMVNINERCEVAIIDEVQLIRDPIRGWAWTRALLGIPADEIHVCGESAAIPLVQSICATAGEVVEIHNYKRLTPLKLESRALISLANVRPGDCIVCFNKNDIFKITRELERRNKEVAVIYGSLPPGAKLAQARKFNDPDNPCKVLVATNAIGMGINLHIGRIIFYSLKNVTVSDTGEREMHRISVSMALQIAGRAGRYKTQYDTGYVTTYKRDDLPVLEELLNQTPEIITQAGLHPTADQIELYAFHLPHSTLSNLLDIFVSLCTVDDSLYFICDISDFKYLADMIQHIPLSLRTRYVFCCAPITKRSPFVCIMFVKFTRQYSKNVPVTAKWLCEQIGWPCNKPNSIADLIQLEAIFDVLDVYLWLSYRFMDMFPDGEAVRHIQRKLDALIQEGVLVIVDVLGKNSQSVQKSPEEVEVEYSLNTNVLNKNKSTIGKGGLTEALLQRGLLTQKMLDELHLEWSKMKKKKSVQCESKGSSNKDD